jgi:hypothetical protein
METAIGRAYSTVRNIHWGDNEEHYRNDIGYKALNSNNMENTHSSDSHKSHDNIDDGKYEIANNDRLIAPSDS